MSKSHCYGLVLAELKWQGSRWFQTVVVGLVGSLLSLQCPQRDQKEQGAGT